MSPVLIGRTWQFLIGNFVLSCCGKQEKDEVIVDEWLACVLLFQVKSNRVFYYRNKLKFIERMKIQTLLWNSFLFYTLTLSNFKKTFTFLSLVL